MKKILLVAAENSAENYAIQVIRESRRTGDEVVFCGIGGDRLREEGMDLWVHRRELSVVGIVEVVMHLPRVFRILAELTRRALEEGVDAVLLIDNPDFNLRLAKRLKRAGIPVFYYIAPTVWAWRYMRVKQIRRHVDHLFIIFPFEREIYEREQIPHTFCGHPLRSCIRISEERERIRERLGIGQKEKLVILMPGSRRQEVDTLLPVMREAIGILKKEFQIKPAIIRAHGIEDEWLRSYPADLDIPVFSQEDRFNLIHAADAVLTTCGTSNLEIALSGTPFTAAYRVHGLSYLLGKWMLRIDLYSIVNILARRKVVGEWIQENCRADFMAAEIKRILNDGEYRNRMIETFQEIKESLFLERDAAEIIWERISSVWSNGDARHRGNL